MNVITNKFVRLKCLTETKIQILYDHVDHARFNIVEIGCQMVQRLSAYIVGPTLFVKLTPKSHTLSKKLEHTVMACLLLFRPILTAWPSQNDSPT